MISTSVVLFFFFIFLQKQGRESPRHEVRELRCGYFEKELIFSMTVLIGAEIALAPPGRFVHFDVCEHEKSTRAQNSKFPLGGVLKQWIQFKITVLSVVQEVPTFGLGVLTDAVTEEPVADCWIPCAIRWLKW